MVRPFRGAMLSLSSALGAALFLIPYQAAGAHGSRHAVELAMLACAAVLCSLTSLRGLRHARPFARTTWTTAGLLGALTVVGNFAVGEALAIQGAGVTSALQQTQIFFVAVAARIVLGERITSRFVLGALVAVSGFVVMQGSPANQISPVGAAWALLSALAFGLMHVITRRAIHQIAPILVNALRLWIAVLVLLCIPGQTAALGELGARSWMLCGLAALSGPYLSRLFIMYAVRHIPASHAVLINLATPVLAFVLGFFLFDEVPSASVLGGALLIIGGVALPLLEAAKEAPGHTLHKSNDGATSGEGERDRADRGPAPPPRAQ